MSHPCPRCHQWSDGARTEEAIWLHCPSCEKATAPEPFLVRCPDCGLWMKHTPGAAIPPPHFPCEAEPTDVPVYCASCTCLGPPFAYYRALSDGLGESAAACPSCLRSLATGPQRPLPGALDALQRSLSPPAGLAPKTDILEKLKRRFPDVPPQTLEDWINRRWTGLSLADRRQSDTLRSNPYQKL